MSYYLKQFQKIAKRDPAYSSYSKGTMKTKTQLKMDTRCDVILRLLKNNDWVRLDHIKKSIDFNFTVVLFYLRKTGYKIECKNGKGVPTYYRLTK